MTVGGPALWGPALHLIGESLTRPGMIKIGEPPAVVSVVALAAVGTLGRVIPALALSGRRDPGRPDDLGPRAGPAQVGSVGLDQPAWGRADGGTT